MTTTYGRPEPALNVGDLIESLKELPPDAPIALVEVTQDWIFDGSPPITTLTLKVWGGLEIQANRIESHPQPPRLL